MLSNKEINELELVDRQKKFAEEYIIDFNGSRAARSAGYSKNAAGAEASRLLKNVKVLKYLEHLMEKRAERVNLTQDMVVKELMCIAFSDIKDLYCPETGRVLQPNELNDRVSKSISLFKVSSVEGKRKEKMKMYKSHDKLKALELLGKHLGVFERDNSQKSQAVTLVLNGSDEAI